MSSSSSTLASVTAADARRAAEFAKHGSEPTRVSILMALGDGDRSGPELIEATASGPAALVAHLGMLRAGGLITTDRFHRESRHSLTPRGRKLLDAIEALAPGA